MNYGQLKDLVLQLLNKYSTRGKELAPTKTADIRLKIESFVNAELIDLASTTGKLRASKSYIVKPVYNELSRDTSSIKTHLPEKDFFVELHGAKAYFFEVSGRATVLIDEQLENGEWVNLETIETEEIDAGMVEYKGLIEANEEGSLIRLTFTGDYIYNYCNYVLYPYSWHSAEEVQQHRPHFVFDLPEDYLEIENVMIKKDARQWVVHTSYILDLANRQIGLNRYTEGEIILNYYRKPKLIEVTGYDEVDDEQIIDATPDGVYALGLGIASLVTAKNDPASSAYFNNLFEVKKSNMLSGNISYTQKEIPIYGW